MQIHLHTATTAHFLTIFYGSFVASLLLTKQETNLLSFDEYDQHNDSRTVLAVDRPSTRPSVQSTLNVGKLLVTDREFYAPN